MIFTIESDTGVSMPTWKTEKKMGEIEIKQYEATSNECKAFSGEQRYKIEIRCEREKVQERD